MAIQFGDLRHLSDLAKAIGASVDDLEELSNANLTAYYTQIQIPRRGRRRRGEFRTVYKARQTLAIVLKNIATAVATSTDFDECVQGFVYKRSIATNARVHLGQRVLLHADIHHFFESITTDQVRGAFASLGCREEIASVLTHLTTREGHLPEGSSASPVIANLVGRHLDVDLKSLARANQCRYTRYADDLTFSGDEVPAPESVETVLNRHGFQLRDGKCRTQRKGRSQFVTGLTVSDPTRPRVARIAKRRLRQTLYYAAKYGLRDHMAHLGADDFTAEWELKRLGGWVTFLYAIEGPEATRWYFEKWQTVRESLHGQPNGSGEPPADPDA